MSDKMRWRYGDTNPVVAAVDAETVIEIGDLVFQEVDDARPAVAQVDQGTDSANRLLFARQFLGVAMQRSRAGDTSPIRVATTGVFEFDCPASTVELGNLVGINKASSGAGLVSQEVVKVSTAVEAIGRVARRSATAVTTVLVDIHSTVMTGGVCDNSLVVG